MDLRHLALALAEPGYAARLDERGWSALLAMAEAEQLCVALGSRLGDAPLPGAVRERLKNAEPYATPVAGENREDALIAAIIDLMCRGDLTHGLRKLWEIDRLIRQGAETPDWWRRVHASSARNGVTPQLSRALRLSRHLFGTSVDAWLSWKPRRSDIWFVARILARDRHGRETRQPLRFAFRLRARWLSRAVASRATAA